MACEMPTTTPAFQRPHIQLLPKDQGLLGDDGSIRSLPDLVRFNAVHNADHLFCAQMRAPGQREQHDRDSTLSRISFLDFHHAVTQCTRWLEARLKDTSPPVQSADGTLKKAPAVALLLESDIGMLVYLVALLTINVPCVLLSIRLNPTAISHLLQQTSAQTILVSSRTRPVAEEALSDGIGKTYSQDVRLESAASYADFLQTSTSLVNGFHERQPLVREDDRNVLILHSSGTTGLPKPIPLAHRYLLGYAACHLFSAEEDVSGLNLSTLPLYHGFGLLAPCLAMSVGMPFGLPHPSAIPTGDSTVALVLRLQPSSLMTVPSILDDICSSPTAADIKTLRSLDFVAVGGGACKPTVAKKLVASGVKLLNHYGATELGALAPIFKPGPEYDWRYIQLRADMGLRLDRVSPDGETPTICKLTGDPFGWNAAFEIQDRLELSPVRPDAVKILGRMDDLIVLATGEKILPKPLEDLLSQDPRIRAAVVFGEGEFEVGVIVEPVAKMPRSQHDTFIDMIWPSVLAGNDLMDDHAKVSSKSAIIITPDDKRVPRSDKGGIMRKETYRLYAAEIDAVYRTLSDGQTNGASMTIDFKNLESSLREMVRACLHRRVDAKSWTDDADFFELGMDSLQATRLRRMLMASVGESSVNAIPRDFVHAHPSVTKMAIALRAPPPAGVEKAATSREEMIKIAHHYAAGLVQGPRSVGAACHVMLLTGSTGNLGAFLLEHLCQAANVGRIICLSRASRGSPLDGRGNDETPAAALRARQERVNQERGITLSEDAWSKITFMSWDAGADQLGLAIEDYRRIVGEVTHIFHGAWPMDFERKLQSFKPQISAVKNLIELARAAHLARPNVKPQLILASSIAVVGEYPRVTGTSRVVESAMDDPSVTLPMGYAQAKWVCEKLVETAAASFGPMMTPMVLRIGQISGSTRTGYWSPAEHFPTIVKASQAIGAFPALKGALSWLPVDIAARSIGEIMMEPGSRTVHYHLENPIRQPCSDVSVILSRKLGLSTKSLIPFGDWLERVKTDYKDAESLLDFLEDRFQSMSDGSLILDTHNTREISPTLKMMGGVSMQQMELYVESWRRVKHLR